MACWHVLKELGRLYPGLPPTEASWVHTFLPCNVTLSKFSFVQRSCAHINALHKCLLGQVTRIYMVNCGLPKFQNQKK